MSRAYSDIAFTPAVRALQTRMGSRANYAPLDHTPERNDRLGQGEAAFIAARDGFYQATVGETGWPYVQFRGGPAGFLKVLDEKTLGYADFRGNVQYISAGNYAGNDRVSIILMDYANRARLKILGRVRVVELNEDPALIARLELADYRACVERGVIITVEGYDWNCPQHITPRFTEAEVAAATAPLRQELAQLKTRLNARSHAGATADAAPPSLGTGALPPVITGIRQLTPRVRAYELRAPDGATLPAVAAGAHIDVPVHLPNLTSGATPVNATRRYSITQVSAAGDSYEIAVQREDSGHGGSLAVHRDYRLGTLLHCGMPGNDFALHTDARPAVLIAGGIGITPIHSMALELARQGRQFSLHYATRSRRDATHAQPLQTLLGNALTLYPKDAGKRLDLTALFANAAADSVFYVCGPASMLAATRAAAKNAGVNGDRLRFEQFAGAAPRDDDQPVRVTLRRSRKIVDVGASQSILDAVQAAGVQAPAACRSGTCGTCAAKVLEGKPAHRDTVLSAAEREQAALMCICVSRATTGTLTLDL